MVPVESLAPWVLILQHESYLPYRKKVIKWILLTTESYTNHVKNQLQKSLDTLIGENQPAAMKKTEQFYILFVIFMT